MSFLTFYVCKKIVYSLFISEILFIDPVLDNIFRHNELKKV